MRFPKVLVLAPVIVVGVTTGYAEPSNLDGDDIALGKAVQLIEAVGDITRWIQLDAEPFTYEEVIENEHGWRFEYLQARFSGQPVDMPAPMPVD